MKSIKQSMILFFAMLVMAGAAAFNYQVIKDLSTVVMLPGKGGANLYQLLQNFELPVTLIGGFFLILICKKKEIEQVIRSFFLLNVCIFASFSALLYAGSTLLDYPVALAAFYLWANLSKILSVVLVWAYANQKYTFKIAAIQYPIFYFLLSGPIMISTAMLLLKIAQHPHMHAIMAAVVAGLSFIILVGSTLLSRIDLGPEEPGFIIDKREWMGLGVAVFGLHFASKILELVLKSQARHLFPTPEAYMAWMSDYSQLTGMFGVTTGILGILMGLFFFFKGIKNVPKVGLVVAKIMVFLGVTSLVTIDWSPNNIEHFTGITSIAWAAFAMLITMVFRGIKELLFFTIEKSRRVTAKLIVDVLLFSLAPLVAKIAVQIAMVMKGAILAHLPLYSVLFMIGMSLVSSGFYVIHRNLKSQSMK